MPPTLIINPISDRTFGEFAHQQLAAGVDSVGRLQERLRERYPHAVVRARELAGERTAVWYVYRDGRWTNPRLDHG